MVFLTLNSPTDSVNISTHIKMRSYYVFIAFFVTLYSCQEIVKTKPAISFKFIERGNESLSSDSSVLLLNLQYLDENNNELFSSKADGRLLAMPFKAKKWGIAAPYAGPFYEIIAACKVGDSIQFQLTAEDLYIKTLMLDEIPPELNLNESSLIDFKVRISDQLTEKEFTAYLEEKTERDIEKSKQQNEARKLAQDNTIKEYLKSNDLSKMKRTSTGLWYEITEEGNGNIPVENDLITIHYKGTLLDGTVFDSSYKNGEPVQFAFGVRDVLQGWDEGFGLLKLGSKATFILPSHLANGSYSDGPIKPYSILKYEVELLEITKRDENFVANN